LVTVEDVKHTHELRVIGLDDVPSGAAERSEGADYHARKLVTIALSNAISDLKQHLKPSDALY
jgi:hypothetical protein